MSKVKTLPEILMEAQGVTPSIDSVNAWEARRIAQEAIAKELMGCLPEKQYYSDDGSMTYYHHTGKNDALDEVRARLTAFIGHKEK